MANTKTKIQKKINLNINSNLNPPNNIKYCLVICGGGGKSTLFEEHPNLYLDIDFYIWNHPVRKIKLEKLLGEEKIDVESLGKIYREVMETDSKLRNDSRIILLHRPENAQWLDRKILGIYRPTKELHEKNIQKRDYHLQELARKDWESLTNYQPTEFNSYPIQF